MSIPTFGANDLPQDIAAATVQNGAAIVINVVPDSLADTVAGELRDNLDEFGYRSQRNFSGFQTKRCHSIIDDAPSSVGLVGHELLMAVTDKILLRHCESYRVSSVTAIEVCPGQPCQSLHRDDCVYPFQVPGVQTLMGCIWALNEFTEDNGATCVVPGIHQHISMGEDVDLSNPAQAATLAMIHFSSTRTITPDTTEATPLTRKPRHNDASYFLWTNRTKS